MAMETVKVDPPCALPSIAAEADWPWKCCFFFFMIIIIFNLRGIFLFLFFMNNNLLKEGKSPRTKKVYKRNHCPNGG